MLKLFKKIPVLCAIVDAETAARAGWNVIDLSSAFLAGGARLLQLRAKQASGAWMLDAASALVERTHAAGGQLIVNDRADIAQLSNADGVHVGQDDLTPANARRIVGDAALVGHSTHTESQVDAALADPISYLAIGPIYGTATKSTGYDPLGVEGVRMAAARAHVRGLPVVAIGGITLDRAPDLIRAGADCVAVIADLLDGDPEKRVRAYIAACV